MEKKICYVIGHIGSEHLGTNMTVLECTLFKNKLVQHLLVGFIPVYEIVKNNL